MLDLRQHFFGHDLSETQLLRSIFRSVPDLISAVGHFIMKHNHAPKPFIWMAKATGILAKVTRACTKLNKLQSA
ncbi:MAG: hypothetical protein ABI228_06580 [Burkholderiaceae bacterium]